VQVYLAARYARLTELAAYRERLERVGINVTSDWLDGYRRVEDESISGWRAAEVAISDLADIRRADVFVGFTEPEHMRIEPVCASVARGGRHVEFGLAYALGKRIIIVGEAEAVFYHLPGIVIVPDWAGALLVLIHWRAAER